VSRPGRPGPGFPLLSGTLGGSPDQPDGNPPPPDCCEVDDTEVPDRGLEANGQRWEGGGGGGGTYYETVLADGPVHYWRLNQSGASTQPDLVGSLDGTPSGGGSLTSVAGATGDGDQALSFSNAALSLAGVGDLPVGSAARSVEFLYKGTDTAKQTVFSYGVASATRRSFAVAVNQGGNGTIGIWTWSDDHSTAVVVNDGAWHHIVVTYAAAASEVLLYVDGVLEDTYSLGGTLNTGTTDSLISGDYHTGAFPVTGAVDDVAVYDAVLSAGDVTAHFDAIAVDGGTPDWVPASNAIDDDDATYDTIVVDSNGMYRLDLGAAYRIQRTRIRIAGTTAGARTFTIKGANLGDYSDAVTLTTIDFTATGGLTAQNVTGTWYTEDSYRYWQLDIDDSDTYRLHSWELYEPTLATNHQHAASDISYDNTTSGLTADDVQEAIDELEGLIGSGDFVTVTAGGGEVISTVATSGAAETIDLANGNVHDITLDADCTFTFTSPAAGRARSFTLFVRQDSSGGWTATWPGSVEWGSGSAPTLATDPNAVDVITFITLDGGTTWFGFATSGAGDADAHIADTTDAHDASAISVVDAGGYFGGTNVESILQEIGAGGLTSEDTSLVEVGATGTTETVDCSTARVHHLVLDDDCTITLAGAVTTEAHRVTVLLQQDGTGGWVVTWPAEVYWASGVAPTLATDPGHTDWIDLLSTDGGAVWLGVHNGADHETDAPVAPGGGSHWPMLALSSA
jgi:hypothetical protein